MLQNFFRTAWRSLTKGGIYALINIAGLSIGMAIVIIIGLWMYGELSFDKNFDNYPRIARVIQNLTNNGEVQTWKQVPYPLAEELRRNYGSDFRHVAMTTGWGPHVISINDQKIKASGGYFEKETPAIFTPRMQEGSASMNDPTSILISRSAAKAFFGNGSAINRIISIDGKPPLKVTGVYEDFPQNATLAGLDFMASWDFYKTEVLGGMEDPWRPNFTTLFVELNPGANLHAVSARIRDAKMKRINAQLQKKKPELFLEPMRDWHLYSEFKNGVNAGGAIQYVRMFGVIGIFVLLLACINFMNLSTARSEKRAKEVGVRKTLGSQRKQLVLQFFSESFLMVTLAVVLSVVMVQLALPFFNEVSGKQVAIPWNQPLFWISIAAFVLFTSLVAGSYPAFYLSSFLPVKVLKGSFKSGPLAALPRKILVVLQFTVSVALIIGTIIVAQQIRFAKQRPIGYDRNGLVSVPTPDSKIHDHFEAFRNELLQSRAVLSVAESQSPTTAIWNSTSGLSWPGKDPNQSIDFGVINASCDYGKTIGWHVKEGRDFSKDLATDSASLILNEAAARFMDLKDPIGTKLTWWGQSYTVIGLIDNMVMESPYDPPRPVVYGFSNYAGNMLVMKIDPASSAQSAIAAIEKSFKKFDPEQPFEYQFVDDDYAKKFDDEARVGKLAGIFAILAVMISCLGLLGLTSFMSEQRKKEIGVRKVLGASVFQLWQLLSKDFVLLVLLSFLMAIPLSWWVMSRWLDNFAYRVPVSWWIFGLAGLMAIFIALATVSFQAIKAARTNPTKNLRPE